MSIRCAILSWGFIRWKGVPRGDVKRGNLPLESNVRAKIADLRAARDVAGPRVRVTVAPACPDVLNNEKLKVTCRSPAR